MNGNAALMMIARRKTVCAVTICVNVNLDIFLMPIWQLALKVMFVLLKLYCFITIDFIWTKKSLFFAVATRLYDSCKETIQCSAYLLTGAKCVENVCVCGPGYYYIHGRCNRYVGKRFFYNLFAMFFHIVNDRKL